MSNLVGAPPLKRQTANAGAGRPRSTAADHAILSAALKLFVQHGFDGVTIEEVAQVAKVARTTVYRRWSSKEALLAKAIALERGYPELELISSPTATLDLPGQLLESISEILTEPNYLKMVARLIGSVPEHPELMSAYWKAYLAPRRQVVRRVVERLRDEGIVRKTANADVLLDLISGAVMHRLLIEPGRPSSRELSAYLLRVIHELGMSEALDNGHKTWRFRRRQGKRGGRHVEA